MSRVGKMPVEVPGGVNVDVNGSTVTVKGPLGSLSKVVGRGVNVALEGNQVVVSCKNIADRQSKANYGTARAHIANMVHGVNKGWKRTLELVGVGYTGKVQGSDLVLEVGFSHEVRKPLPPSVKCNIEKTKLDFTSYDIEELSAFVAAVRKVQPPEPYLGKGIKYSDEVVRRKAGKTGKK